MSIPPISGSNPYQGEGGKKETVSEIITRLRLAWAGDPSRENAQKLLDYMKNHRAELKEEAEANAEYRDEEGLEMPEPPFKQSYNEAVAALQKWMDDGCNPTDIAKTRTAIAHLAAWVSDGVCE